MSATTHGAGSPAAGIGEAPRDGEELRALRRELLATHLAALLGSTDPAIASDLLRLGDWMKLPGGGRVFNQGDPGDSMYLVLTGRLVAIAEDSSGRRRVVGHVQPGESVGEMGLIARQPRSATVQALRDTVVIRISERAFQQLVASHPELVGSTARLIVRRTTEVLRGQLPVQRRKNVAVVPVSPRAHPREFVERLRDALARHGPARVVDASCAAAALSSSGASGAQPADVEDLRLSTWLDEQELLHDAVIYATERPGDAWTERSIRQADVVLLLASSDDAPDECGDALGAVGGDPFDARRELVLLHAREASPPAATARWLDRSGAQQHHHVRWERDADFHRLARFVTGRAVGLVLGGGGARGFAHLGVIRALREAGIPIDAVGGTSQGAIVAATVAMDWSDAEIERLHREGFTRRNPIGDYALVPHVALVRGKRLAAELERGFGTRDVEDTWLPFFCVSTNLTLARSEVHARGSLCTALRASVSIPGILPPVVIGDHLHVDGALLDNLPVQAMRARGVGRVIAVDLTVEHERAMSGSGLPTATQFVKERLFSRARAATPGLGSILMKSLMLPSIQRTREVKTGADLYLNPNVAAIGFLDWAALDRGIELGYRHASEELRRVRGVRSWTA